ncbi:MAG: hypothetical protein Q9183_006571 [Haloplaca sp. 2 TL-2023]
MRPTSTNGVVHEASPNNGTRPKRPASVAETSGRTDATTARKSTISSSSRTIPNGSTTRALTRAPPNTSGLRSTTTASSSPITTRDRHSRAPAESAASPSNGGLYTAKEESAPGKSSSSEARPGSTSPLKRGPYLGPRRMTNSQSPIEKRKAQHVPGNLRSSLGTSASNGKGHTSSARADVGASKPPRTSAKAISVPSGEETNDSMPPRTLSNASLPSPKPIRPTLDTRKSTKSVTVQQLVQEVSMVHDKLRVAMAEGGKVGKDMRLVVGMDMNMSLKQLKDTLKATLKEDEPALSTEQSDGSMPNAPKTQHSADDADNCNARPAHIANGRLEAKPEDDRPRATPGTRTDKVHIIPPQERKNSGLVPLKNNGETPNCETICSRCSMRRTLRSHLYVRPKTVFWTKVVMFQHPSVLK